MGDVVYCGSRDGSDGGSVADYTLSWEKLSLLSVFLGRFYFNLLTRRTQRSLDGEILGCYSRLLLRAK